MSALPVMEKLLEGVEVDWKVLSDVGQLVRGNGLQKKDFTESGVPAIHYGQIYTYYGNETVETKSFVSEELAKQLKKVNRGDVVITNTSENLEDVGKSLLYLGAEQAVTGGHATIFKPSKDVLGKYFVYWTQTKYFFDEKRRYAKGTKVIDVSATDLSKFLIPIPPLNVQAEIVRILDAFTAYTAELTAELTARKKQYNHYRDQLLSFSETGVELKTLSTLVDDKFWIMPATPKFDEDGDVPYITSKNVRGGHVIFEKVKFISLEDYQALSRNRPILAGDFLISMIGTIGEIAQVKESDLDFYGQNMYLIRLNKNLINERFFYYFFDCEKMKNYFNSIKNNSGQGYLKANHIDDIKVPVPPLEEQARIVAILDKFDALTASISEGLPREIELRQKQYEYYRDRLLSFPKPASDAAA